MLRLRRTIAAAAAVSTEGQDKLKTSRIIWRKDGSSRKEDEAPNTPRSMQRFSEHEKEIAKLKMEFFSFVSRSQKVFYLTPCRGRESLIGFGKRICDHTGAWHGKHGNRGICVPGLPDAIETSQGVRRATLIGSFT